MKTYNLVAVKPLNQSVFDQACQKLEVDIIAIDFSEKLPFRLKLPMVKAAIKRGVYFEITYSNLIADVQTRRQVISNAKLLVDWTRGKNLIFSSAAPSVNELRGPYDVANLSSLLGLTMERAKAAISKNCRSLIANALRKKQFYKEAIKVEAISSSEQLDSKEHWSGDLFKWDPISSGEGDLLLDDMAKSFSASTKVSKTVKAIDFASVVDSMPSHGFQVKALISHTETVPQPPDNGKNCLSSAEVVEVSAAASGLPEQLNRSDFPKPDQSSLYDTPSMRQTSGCENSKNLYLPSDTTKAFTDSKEIRTLTTTIEVEPDNSNGLDVSLALDVVEKHDLQLKNCVSSHVVLSNDNVMFHTSTGDLELDAACDIDAKGEISMLFKDIGLPAPQNEESKSLKSSDVALDVKMDGNLPEVDINDQEHTSLALNDVSLHECFPERAQFMEPGNDALLLTDCVPIPESSNEMKVIDETSMEKDESPEVTMEEQKHGEADTEVDNPTLVQSISGKSRAKRRTSHRVPLLPFKRLLNPIPFKRKTKKIKRGIKMV